MNPRLLLLPLAILIASSSTAVARDKATRGHSGAATHPPAAEPPTPDSDGGPQFHAEEGPKTIDLGHDLVFELPANMLFLERVQAKKVLEQGGNVVGDSLLGVVGQKGSSWIVTFSYFEDGYVKDDEAADFKADDVLDSIREGNDEANEIRKERGFKPLHIDGWTQSPRYDKAAHHLVWGIKVSDADGMSINFYTRMLGRRGFVAINLIDDPARIEASKKEALAVLEATTFRPGARYADFDSTKDKVAEYGLAALVAGGAGAAALKLAKVGLLAKFGGKLIALLIAGKKLLVVFLLGIVAAIKRLFGLRKEPQPAAALPPSEPPSEPPPAP